MKLLDFAVLVCDKSSVINYLRTHGLLALSLDCIHCNKEMTTQKSGESPDGFAFRCCKCKRRASIRRGSIFDDARLSLEEVISIVFLMSLEVNQRNICDTLRLNESTVITWESKIRNLYSEVMVNHNVLLGGLGNIVEVDESVIAKTKPTRNGVARPVPAKWVVGLFDRTTKVGHVQLIEGRSEDDLLPIIQSVCVPGSTIYTDGWSGYNGLSNLGFIHGVVVHERHFVDPETGVHTNNVESYWKRCKRKLKQINGARGDMLGSYLDEFLWCERFGKTAENRFKNTLALLRLRSLRFE
jgi:transposase-like protein